MYIWEHIVSCNFNRLCGKVLHLHFFCVISMLESGRMLIIIDLNALRILINFGCIYLSEGKGVHLCMYIYGNTYR